MKRRAGPARSTRRATYLLGLFTGIMLATCVSVFAVGYSVEKNPYQIKINDEPAYIEGFLINGHTYFQLRDVGEKMGFQVDFSDDIILINREGAEPEPTGETPTGSDCKYTVDGLQAWLNSDGKYYIDLMGYEKTKKGDYAFKVSKTREYYIGWRNDVYFETYPHNQYGDMELEWYNTVFYPWLIEKGWAE